MVDALGPWGTGPFTLVEGHSTLDTDRVAIGTEPFAATYLWREDRTPRLRLAANPGYWDTERGPRLREVVFRNDLSPARALDLVCTTEGEVDIVTEVSPADAGRVEDAEHARLVVGDPVRVIAGIIDRGAADLPLGDRRARLALNLAVDRDALAREAMFGHAQPLAGLTPPAVVPVLNRVLHPLFGPHPHDPERAAELWREAGGAGSRPLRVAAPAKLEPVARRVAADLRAALGVDAELAVLGAEGQREARRRLAERSRPRAWDILVWEQAAQVAEGAPLELHRAFAGATGAILAGPVVPEFEALLAELVGETAMLKQAPIAYRLDRLVHDEALALSFLAPRALYAVNRHVNFTPYRTSFELAECQTSPQHWSRRDQAAPT
jgi:peptide/nickel transport system substrate-binding protein